MNQVVSVQELRTQLAARLQQQQSSLPPPSSTRIKLTKEGLELPTGARMAKISAVVVDMVYINTWYNKRYIAGQVESPACWALNANFAELAPDKSVEKPAHATCEGCPNNEWDSGPGGRGKACGNKVRLAIVTPDSTNESPVFTVDLPPTSQSGFVNLLRKLAVPIQSVVLSIEQDPKSEYPKLLFNTVGEISPELAPHIMPLVEKAQENLNRGFNYDG